MDDEVGGGGVLELWEGDDVLEEEGGGEGVVEGAVGFIAVGGAVLGGEVVELVGEIESVDEGDKAVGGEVREEVFGELAGVDPGAPGGGGLVWVEPVWGEFGVGPGVFEEGVFGLGVVGGEWAAAAEGGEKGPVGGEREGVLGEVF